MHCDILKIQMASLLLRNLIGTFSNYTVAYTFLEVKSYTSLLTTAPNRSILLGSSGHFLPISEG